MCAQMNKESIFLSLECADFFDGFFFNFEMPLELNPDNSNAIEMLDKLKKKEVSFGILFAV
jgi:hypothetical protein